MTGQPPGRGETGETVASFPTYEGAQKAVSALIAGDVPAREIAIVGTGLRSIERVTGRLGYATAARSGAINGMLLGLFFSAIFVLGNPGANVSLFVGVLFVGIAFGMLVSLVTYALLRRRKDFASVMQVMADHYDVNVQATSIHRARQVLGPYSPAPAPAAHPEPWHPGIQQPSEDHDADAPPPRYGERIPPATPADDAHPSADGDADGDREQPSGHGDAPPPPSDR